MALGGGMTRNWALIFIASGLVMATSAQAKSLKLSAADQLEEVPPLPEDADRVEVDQDSEAGDQDDERTDNQANKSIDTVSGRWRFSGAVGASSDFVSGQANVGYYWVRYVGVETNFYYFQISNEQVFGSQYGPEVDLLVRLYNWSMLTPFGGFGPGYSKWHRRYQGVNFSDGSSFTGNVLFGVDVALTSHFGIQFMRKNITYWGDVPVSFTDRAASEARSTWFTNIGFRLLF
jgi:hypothetical protein